MALVHLYIEAKRRGWTVTKRDSMQFHETLWRFIPPLPPHPSSNHQQPVGYTAGTEGSLRSTVGVGPLSSI